ncbi:hypothetical protein R3W88_014656 [Solanum pinnatisectum]|uniref:Uncharacterized protein n=1 Tax=Solanum pinnatisectum TaxID=50273 RepID=A0AAV9KSM7_9SOLN|nr:hypothetical protein R3W88_014656 [Solanum pinnatisectum]
MNIVESFIEFLVGGVVGVSYNLIHVPRCNFCLNLSYIEGINDSKCLRKEPLKFRRFRDEKRRRKVVKHLGIGVGHRASQRTPKESLNAHPWGAALVSMPQIGL